MNEKSSMLSGILDNLSDDENELFEKTATDNGSVKNTETPGTGKSIPEDKPSSSEAKLKVPGLGKLQKEIFHEVPTVTTVKDGGSTENVSEKPKKVEPAVMFEKKASADILESLLETAGLSSEVGLDKVASADEEDGLLKIAYDTISEMEDLEKVADDMAHRAADTFLAIVAEKM